MKTTDLGNKEIMAINLQRFMDEFNIDRNKVAEIAGVSYFTVTAWLKGRTYPRIDKIEILANYFGVKKSELVERKISEDLKVVDEITHVSKKLKSERRDNVLDFAKKQLSEQEDEISESENQIYAYIDEILDRQVAWQGQKLSEEGREAVREGIKKFLDENPDRLPKL